MESEVLQILIIAVAVVIVVVLALIFGRRLKATWGDKSVETDRGRAAMNMTATRGTIEEAEQVSEGEATADMNMTARDGSLKKVKQQTGTQSGRPS